MPEGYEIVFNKRTGMPLLKKRDKINRKKRTGFISKNIIGL